MTSEEGNMPRTSHSNGKGTDAAMAAAPRKASYAALEDEAPDGNTGESPGTPDEPPSAPIAPPAAISAGSKSPSSFRVDPRAATLAVQRILFTVRIHTPKTGDEFFRAHPDPAFAGYMWVLDSKEQGSNQEDIYLLDPSLIEADAKLAAKARMIYLVTCVDTTNSPFVWPIKLDRADAKEPNQFNATAMDVFELAKTTWVQKVNTGGAYAAEVAPGAATFKPPVWPKMTFDQICDLAFKDRTITEMTHKVVQIRLGFVQP
jgi:hypothetical protein